MKFKGNKFIRRMAALGAALCLMFFATTFSGCGYTYDYRDGVINSGLYVRDGSSTLSVTEQQIEYEIVDFPQAEGEYRSTFSTTYVLTNNTDEVVTEELATPLWYQPEYWEGDMPSGSLSVNIDGKEVPFETRHVLSRGVDRDDISTSSLLKELQTLSDEYVESEFINRQSSFTVYTISAEGLPDDGSVYLRGFLPEPEEGVFYWGDIIYQSPEEEYFISKTYYGKEFKFSVVGGSIDENDIQWTLEYSGSTTEEGKQEDVEADLQKIVVKKSESTLGEYAESQRGDRTDISDIDWYNMVLAKESTRRMGSTEIYTWQLFDVVVQPQSSVTVTVTTPVMPYLNIDFEPYLKVYYYAAPPEEMWAEVGENFTTAIRTDYYAGEIGLYYMVKTENGFTIDYGENFNGRIRFSLSEIEEPINKHQERTDQGVLVLFMLFMLPVLVLIVVKVVGLIILFKTCRKKKNKQ